MRWRGINHVELSVLDYEKSIAFYDLIFGWLGYKSFWTLDVGYRSTYYMARFPMPHSYIGIQPAKTGDKVDFPARPVGIHHIALWARNRREVDDFHQEVLVPNAIPVTEAPAEYPVYAPGYYATFFNDPLNGIHWELAHIPRLPSLRAIRNWRQALKAEEQKHPDWKHPFATESVRQLPQRKR
nr:VOC family protein [uncultured Cohaesibacter sp.]